MYWTPFPHHPMEEVLQSTLSWLLSSDPFSFNSTPPIEYTPLSLPGSHYIDDSPLVSYDYLHEFSIYCLHIAFEKYLLFGSYELILMNEIETGDHIRSISGDFDWVCSLR